MSNPLNPVITNALRQPVVLQVAIQATGTVSNAINLQGYTLVALATDAAWTPSEVTISLSYDGSTYLPVYSSSGAQVVLGPVPTSSITTVYPGNIVVPLYIQLTALTTQTDTTVISLITTNA